jgi:hypothetical protein
MVYSPAFCNWLSSIVHVELVLPRRWQRKEKRKANSQAHVIERIRTSISSRYFLPRTNIRGRPPWPRQLISLTFGLVKF